MVSDARTTEDLPSLSRLASILLDHNSPSALNKLQHLSAREHHLSLNSDLSLPSRCKITDLLPLLSVPLKSLAIPLDPRRQITV